LKGYLLRLNNIRDIISDFLKFQQIICSAGFTVEFGISYIKSLLGWCKEQMEAYLSWVERKIKSLKLALEGYLNTVIDWGVLDYLEKISVSSLHLLSLINDVLDMSSIESGKVTIEETPLHLPSFINDLKIMCQASILDKNIRLNFKTEQIQHKNIITDKVRLNQILLNILSNAIKFSNNGGKIDFEINVSQNEVNDSQSDNIKNFIFKIRDNGCGMSESFQKELFDTFTREKTSTDSGLQGTGLGMAITKRLVELMNGSISVESREGEGTLFTVTLPIKINGEKSEEEQETVKNKKEFEGKRLLLAEDNEMNQLIAKEILENSGFTVEIANDGEEAVQKVKENPEDFFLRFSGFFLCK